MGDWTGPGSISSTPVPKKRTKEDVAKVKVTSEGIAMNTHIMVGDQELRFTKASIEIDVKDGYARLKLETYADLIDIEALEKNTEIIIKKRDHEKNL